MSNVTRPDRLALERAPARRRWPPLLSWTLAAAASLLLWALILHGLAALF